MYGRYGREDLTLPALCSAKRSLTSFATPVYVRFFASFNRIYTYYIINFVGGSSTKVERSHQIFCLKNGGSSTKVERSHQIFCLKNGGSSTKVERSRHILLRKMWRRERDSNPRYRLLAVHAISSRAPSASSDISPKYLSASSPLRGGFRCGLSRFYDLSLIFQDSQQPASQIFLCKSWRILH